MLLARVGSPSLSTTLRDAVAGHWKSACLSGYEQGHQQHVLQAHLFSNEEGIEKQWKKLYLVCFRPQENLDTEIETFYESTQLSMPFISFSLD